MNPVELRQGVALQRFFRTLRRYRHTAVKTLAILAAGAVLALAAPGPAAAQEPDFLAFSAGGFDVNDNETAAEVLFEYRWDKKLVFVGRTVGLMVNSDGGVYGYGGLTLDLFFGRRFVVSPNFAVGGYVRGNGKDLGSVAEFRSGVDFSYRFDDRSRLGIAFHHISNAGIDDNNPGTESLVITYAVPLARLF